MSENTSLGLKMESFDELYNKLKSDHAKELKRKNTEIEGLSNLN